MLIQKTLNLAVRFIFRLKKYDHLSYWYAKLKWLTVHQMTDFSLALFMYKVKHNHYPQHFNDYINNILYKDTCNDFGFRSNVFPVPTVKTRAAQSSIIYRGTKVWNALPCKIRSINTIGMFKGEVREYLLKQ